MALKSLGYVTITTPGTPVQVTRNFTLATGQPVPFQSLLIQAHPDNTGKIYIYEGMPTPVIDRRSTGVGCMAILPAPADPIVGPFPSASFGLPATPNGVNAAQVWVDADDAEDAVIVSGTIG